MATIEKLVGKVTVKHVGGSSKSARDAVVLESEQGDFVLRRRGGHPFSDPEITALVGKTISATGRLANAQLIMSEWDEV